MIASDRTGRICLAVSGVLLGFVAALPAASWSAAVSCGAKSHAFSAPAECIISVFFGWLYSELGTGVIYSVAFLRIGYDAEKMAGPQLLRATGAS